MLCLPPDFGSFLSKVKEGELPKGDLAYFN
jgi:hypothetical protein